jgi:hypothetical protein
MTKLLILLTLISCSQKDPKYKVGQSVVFNDEIHSYCINRGIITNYDEDGYTVTTMQRSNNCPSIYKMAEEDIIEVIDERMVHITADPSKWVREK